MDNGMHVQSYFLSTCFPHIGKILDVYYAYPIIFAVTKVHRISLRLYYNNYGFIFVHRHLCVRTVSFLTVVLDMRHNGYVWYVLGATSFC